MKAIEQWSEKFNLKTKIQGKRKDLKDSIESLKKVASLHRLVRRLDFPCVLRYNASYGSISFHAPQGGWQNDKEFHKSLASLVKQFGVRFERKFSDYGGNYYWSATTRKGISITLYDAVKPENCEVVSYTETVTRYKSVCGKQDKDAEKVVA